MRVKECGEFGFIDSIKEDTIVDPSTVTVGIGDDCAVYSAEPNREQLITTDMMVAGIHFSPKTTKPFDVGYRLGAANISDIAAGRNTAQSGATSGSGESTGASRTLSTPSHYWFRSSLRTGW